MRIYLRLLVAFLLLSAGNVVYAEAQQEKRVTGTVTSEGEPLPGVSVQVKGASSGTITDIDGNYSIEAPANGTIVFRFVGLRTVEQAVNNRNVINVTMESESKELEEVMVVAYATAKKYSFTGAASTMKAGEIEKLQTSSVSRVLEGTVSGVQASASSGQPGTDAEIRIRGIGSINASSAPLYVVDGVPFDGSVNSINPDDIASMTVLKDAAAAALYGPSVPADAWFFSLHAFPPLHKSADAPLHPKVCFLPASETVLPLPGKEQAPFHYPDGNEACPFPESYTLSL